MIDMVEVSQDNSSNHIFCNKVTVAAAKRNSMQDGAPFSSVNLVGSVSEVYHDPDFAQTSGVAPCKQHSDLVSVAARWDLLAGVVRWWLMLRFIWS